MIRFFRAFLWLRWRLFLNSLRGSNDMGAKLARWGQAIVGVAVYGALSHVNEPLAAIAWFSMVTWLYIRTKSIWNCVIAHAITNLLLGLFVIKTGTWSLW